MSHSLQQAVYWESQSGIAAAICAVHIELAGSHFVVL